MMSFRRNLLLFTACTAVAISPAYRRQALADQPADPQAGPPANRDAPVAVAQGTPSPLGGSPSTTSAATAEQGGDEPITDVEVKRQQLLLKQKDVTSAITEIGPREIQATGNQGSVQSLLQQSAPGIHVYQQGPGQNFPVISVRGVRGAELAQTLDGVPTQDLIFGGQGAFEVSNVGAPFDIEQIEGVTVYPGITTPGTQGYGTIGGTLAYSYKKPTAERYVDLFGSVGSFGPTTEYGFEANSGSIEELGGLKTLLRYSGLNTGGYVDNTNAQYRDMMFAFDKPYDSGLSHVSGTVIYNNDFGYIQPQPTATPLLDFYGKYYNPPKSEQFLRQNNDFLTVIISDQTYVSDMLNISGDLFYLHNNSESITYENPNLFQFGTPLPGGAPNQSYYYFAQNQFSFIPGSFFGPNGNGNFYNSRFFRYDPSIYGNVNLGYGANAQRTEVHTDTFGAQPKVQVFLPYNNITIGALIARAKQSNETYLGGTPDIPTEPLVNGPFPGFNGTGSSLRTIYQVYGQDKIDLFDNTLHLEPGLIFEGALGQNNIHSAFPVFIAPSTVPPLVGPNGNYTLQRWDRELLPFFGASYDLPYDVSLFGSAGTSALFAPVSDYTLGSAGSSSNAPYAAIARSVEGGVRYNTTDLYMNLDYFYQKIDRAFGFFQNPVTGTTLYANNGAESFTGVEAAFKYKITPEVSLFGNAAYVKSLYLTTYEASTTIGEDQFGRAFKGQPVAYVPDWTSTIGVDYNTRSVFVEADEVFVRIFANYTGAQTTTYDLSPNSTSVGSGANLVPAALLQVATTPSKNVPYYAGLQPPVGGTFGSIPPYWLLNAVADYTYPIDYAYVKQVKMELNVQNIFNTHYFGYLYNGYAPLNGQFNTGPAFNNGIVGPPASITLTGTVRF